MNYAPTVPAPTHSAYAELTLPPSAETTMLLYRLLEKVERIEDRMMTLDPLLEQAPGLVSMATDTIDNLVFDAKTAGIDLDTRMKQTLALLEQLTQPTVIHALTTLVNNLGMIENILNETPAFVAMAVDAGDELYANIKHAGIDPERLVQLGLATAQNTLTMVEAANTTQPLGPWGMIRALADPDVQRALGFLTNFARAFGQSLPQSALR